MSLTPEDINKIADLAALSLSESEKEQYTSQLSNILQLFEQMDQANTDEIVPMAHPLHATQRCREDKVNEIDEHKQFQAIAPKVEVDLYLVPKVIEGED